MNTCLRCVCRTRTLKRASLWVGRVGEASGCTLRRFESKWLRSVWVLVVWVVLKVPLHKGALGP